MKEEIKTAVIDHWKRYPKAQLQDLFKYLYQSSFGCEHLIASPEAVEGYIRQEAERAPCTGGEFIESLNGAYCRVHLDCIREGLCAETLAKLFFLSAGHVEDGKEQLEKRLSVLLETVEEGLLPFETEAVTDGIRRWREAGYPACRHSETFRKEYAPAYRLVKKEYGAFLPLFLTIDRMLREGPVNLAIEGGSAYGKTTLGNLLAQIYDCNVFHMDDFFLRPEQRTKERFAEPGGNVDRERFLTEVLTPLHHGEPVSYRKFDCSTFTLTEPVVIQPKELNVIEGAYSMHPELEGYYNLSVYLEVSPELQKQRILKRNTPELAIRFFEEWIPMEQRYFKEFKVKERCDMVFLFE
ncbi:MAG: hypothetical protein IKB07_06040 [Lachnospiraceae bacterium]|nr:hypothetical protein [Lachnospiraceae bacterium]